MKIQEMQKMLTEFLKQQEEHISPDTEISLFFGDPKDGRTLSLTEFGVAEKTNKKSGVTSKVIYLTFFPQENFFQKN